MAENLQRYLSQAGISEVSTSRIDLNTRYEYVKSRQEFVGYAASVYFNVLLSNLSRIEEVLVGVVNAGANSIHDTSFQTTRLKELRAEARRQAVAAAREKAENYCKAAGVSLGNVLHIEDVNPDMLRGREGHTYTQVLVDDDSPPQAFSTGSIAVQGAVMITYSLK